MTPACFPSLIFFVCDFKCFLITPIHASSLTKIYSIELYEIADVQFQYTKAPISFSIYYY